MGLEVEWDGMEQLFKECWLAAANPWHGDERQFADHGWQCAGGIFFHVNMVAAVEEVHRARAFAEAIL